MIKYLIRYDKIFNKIRYDKIKYLIRYDKIFNKIW